MATAAAAAAADAGVNVAVDDTVCSICHEFFTKPKLISCGHILCRHCLLDWLTAQQDAACPLCRRPIVSPETRQSQSPGDIVDSFPTEVTMEIWVKSEQLLQKDHGCQSCVTQAATSLCLHCHDFLCTSCSTMHGRLSSTRHHAVESLSSLTAETLAASFPTTCQAHSKETCKLYCSTHQTPICMLCASTKHKNCTEVKDLEERAEETRAVLTDIETTLTAQETKLNQAIQELDDLFQEMEKKAQAAAAQVMQTFDQLEAVVKKRRHEALEATGNTFDEAKKSIQVGKATLLQGRGAVMTYKIITERGKGMAASGDVGDLAVAMKKRAGDVDSCSLLPADAPDIKRAALVMDTKAVVSGVENALAEAGQCTLTPADVKAQVTELHFHKNCGKNITLSNNRQTAERKGRNNNGGIVVSDLPMVPHRLYEVHLDDKDAFGGYYNRGAFNGYYMWTGAATTNPGVMTLPSNANGWKSAVVFCNSYIKDHGKRIDTNVGGKLPDLPKGSRIGLLVDGSQQLHLYIDGQDQGVAGVKVPHPCYAFFDVYGPYRKVTAQPVRRIP